MKIKDITIRNFRSIYGELYLDFNDLQGLIKLSGVIGSGKTTIGESILYGLYGKVKEHKNPALVSWHVKNSECSVELNIISKNKEINIKRSLTAPLEVRIDGRLLSASNKRDTQEVLEEEYYDVPRLAVEKMCIISFNAFKNSLANMNPSETRQFLDDIFGFKTFTEYNDQIIIERKYQITENTQLNTILNETRNQIENLKHKRLIQTSQLKSSIDIKSIQEQRQNLINQGIEYKKSKQEKGQAKDEKVKELDGYIKECQHKMVEAATLGKQAKDNYNTFKSGKCPTCGHDIDPNDINSYKDNMNQYATIYREHEAKKKEHENNKQLVIKEYNSKCNEFDEKMDELRTKISSIDAQIKSYNDSVQLINDNYDELITELENKTSEIEDKIRESDKDIGEWNDMNELFSKTLRYSLLDTLIPHINKSIKYYMNKLNQPYNVEYDQEFKPHIWFDDNEISYSDLSTGQKKTLDIGIIFGIIANVIANVDFNIFFLDELFSNMDSDSRNTMLTLLNDNLTNNNNRTIFVVNHAEMPDDFFSHKVRVKLESRKIIEKKEPVLVLASKYEKIF